MSKSAWLFAVLLVLGFGGFAEASSTTYMVAKNDNLTSIARKFYGSAEAYRKIAADNGISNHDMILAGSTLVIKHDAVVMANRTSSKSRAVSASTPATEETITIVNTVVDEDDAPRIVAVDDAPQIVDIDDAPQAFFGEAISQSRTKAPRSVRSTPARQRNVRRTAKETMTLRAANVIAEMSNYFPGGSLAYMLAIGYAESGLKLDAKGYNCTYQRWSWKKMRYVQGSRACKYEERYGPTNWSVDCGILQINVKGQQCPSHLYTLEGNLREARRRYNEGGYGRWSTYTNGSYRNFIQHSTSLVAMMSSGGLEATRMASMSQD